MSEMSNSVAGAWERNVDFVDEHMTAATEALLDAAEVEENDAVLDLATGPGGAGLVRVGPRRPIGTRGARGGQRCRPTCRGASKSGDGGLRHQSVTPESDATFDAVISRHGLMFVEEPIAAVREAARVAKPGGRYAAMTWDRRSAIPGSH